MSFTDMSGQDCLDCPSHITPEEASTFFGITAFTPMCARHGYLMAKPTGKVDPASDQEVTVHWASKCSDFGKARPINKTMASGFTPLLFMPDVDILDKQTNDTTVSGCGSCSNLVQDEATGVRGCKPRGIVIFNGREETEAAGCHWRDRKTTYGIPSEKMKLVPPFDVPVMTPTRKKPAKTALFSTIDPTAYDSDAPVADEHKEMIQAWRRITITDSDEELYLPVFRTDFFSEKDQLLIPKRGASNGDPTLYVDHSGLEEKFAVTSYTLDMPLTLVGEPGSGKTEGIKYLAYRLNVPYVRMDFNEYTEPEAILGQPGIKDGDTTFELGPLPIWWQKVCLLASEEFNLPQEGIQQVYRSMNDSSRTLTVYGETFQRHDYCFHCLAINPPWDYRNIGAKELASADIRRLSYHYMPLPDKATAKAIIVEAIKRIDGKALPTAKLDAIMKIADDLKEMAKQGKIPHHWTLSQDVKVARFALYFGLERAYRSAYFDYIDPETSAVAMSMIKSMIPSGM